MYDDIGEYMAVRKLSSVQYAARSDIGRRRENNEDNLYCCRSIITENMRDGQFKIEGESKTPVMFAVCDGVGGCAFGEIASLIAVKALLEFEEKLLNVELRTPDVTFREYVNYTNVMIQQEAESLNTNMGTTLALIIVAQDKIFAYNMGDSRIYLFDKGELNQLSTDHTVAMEKRRQGLVSDIDGTEDMEEHQLTSCLGFLDSEGKALKEEVIPPIEIKGKKRILICSDGLSDMLSFEEIKAILKKAKNTGIAASKLMSQALNNGGEDNITIIVLDIEEKRKCFWFR